jgi:hypothetical protein
VLLSLLVKTFVADGPLVIGVDETLERRWGKKIAAKGVYRDPVRSTQDPTSSVRSRAMSLLTSCGSCGPIPPLLRALR